MKIVAVYPPTLVSSSHVFNVMKVVRNIVEDVKFIIATMVCSVLVAVWHYECHQPIEEIRND
jgi:hypothetical protein